MLYTSHLLVLVLTCRSVLSAYHLRLDEVQAISDCPDGVETCDGKLTSMNYEKYAESRCFCDADCHLFGECCIDRALYADTSSSVDNEGAPGNVKDQLSVAKFRNRPNVTGEIKEITEVFGIPRDRWDCQNFVVTTTPILPVKRVRMVVSCPADASTDMLEKCAALNRSSSDFHYTMDIPVLSSTSGTWYQNVYCAICNGDADNLVRLKYFLECEGNYTREKVLSEGKYSTEPLHWSLDGQHESQCRLRIELQPGAFSGFLRPCGKVNERGRNLPLIENCPVDWTDSDIAKKCKAYAFYSVWNSRVTQNVEVFKNPDCAVCNGVPPLKTTCWSKKPSLWRVAGRLPKPSFSIVMDFMAWEDESEQYRSCRPPNGVWDVLHETCIQVANAHDNAEGGGRSSRMLNHTCPTITLSASEFLILDNGYLQYTGNNSLYVGHIFDLFEILEDYTAIVCAIKYDEDNDDLISGAYEGYLTQFCLSVSVICLILHIGIYYALPKLCNLPGRNLLSLSWAILFAQAGFLLAVNPAFEVPLGVCIGFAVLEYYCFLAAFFWMNVMSVDVWRTFSRSALRGSGGLKTHCRYAGYAWGTSALIALLALTVDLSTDDGAVKPYFGRGQVCWFGNRGGLGLFLAMPLFVLLMVNSGLFANTVYWIWQARRQGARYIRDKTRDELIQTSARSSTDLKGTIRKRNEVSGVTGRKDQARFYLYLKLFVIMGLTWVFGFIAAFARVPLLWYPFILFNGLQGAFIFVMFDMKRNIACMLWDKYISRHGYKPPGFLMASSTSSTTRTTGSSKRKSREPPLGSAGTHAPSRSSDIRTASSLQLAPTGT